MDSKLASDIKHAAESLKNEITELRHWIHEHAEASWEEVETTKRILREIEPLELSNVKHGFGGTESGVTADLIGDPNGPMIALRADIDALRLTEENDHLPYKSKNVGAMHACGHDSHTANLVGVAKILHKFKDRLPGRVRFLFQPAEEHGIKSGAKALVEAGALDGVSVVGGMHIGAGLPTGHVTYHAGPMQASADMWEVKFIGNGGHGASPHMAHDPVVPAGIFVSSVQMIVAKEIDPTDTVVIHIGKINGGSAFNIIPETVTITGGVRTFNPKVRNSIEERMRRIADGIAAAHCCRAEVTFHYMIPVNINDPEVTNIFLEAAKAVHDPNDIEEVGIRMGSEDFSFYVEKVPGVFFSLGCGNHEKKTDNPHHSPHFNVDDDAFPAGMSLMSAFAFTMLEKIKSGEFKR